MTMGPGARGALSPLPTPSPTLAERWAESRAPLVERLRDEIRAEGPMTFARFMEAALYDPLDGYYRRRHDRATRGGDFLTAPEMDPLFGAALARQLEEMWERLGRPSRFVLLDEGAGTGALGEAVMGALIEGRAPLAEALSYLPVEADAGRAAHVRERLTASGMAARLAPADEAERPLAAGCIVANELLDAFPVHRLVMAGGALRELYVTWHDDWFADEPGEPSTPALAETLARDGVVLEDGQRAEVCLAAQAWAEGLRDRIERGYALVIDYGFAAEALYAPSRREGLLRTYHSHHVGSDPYRAVGEQDLTAHVDFTALERSAVEAGLLRLGRTTQAEFLAGLDAGSLLLELQARPGLTAERYRTARASLMRWLDPAAMGRFGVLVLGRGVRPEPALRGLAFRLPARRRGA